MIMRAWHRKNAESSGPSFAALRYAFALKRHSASFLEKTNHGFPGLHGWGFFIRVIRGLFLLETSKNPISVSDLGIRCVCPALFCVSCVCPGIPLLLFAKIGTV